MQIQRIQTLWLLAALGCMVAFIVLPFGYLSIDNAVAALRSYDFLGLIIPAGLAALFLLVSIFSFKAPATQRSIVLLSLMMTLVSVGITVYLLCDRATQGVIEWAWPTAFLAAAFVAELLAVAGINHDIKLLRSYDRLR